MEGNKYSEILFDLDGTLTDSGPGIMHGFEYAITQFTVVNVLPFSLIACFVCT